MIGGTDLGRRFVVDEGQEGVTNLARHLGHRMQERTREHHGHTGRRLEPARSILGEADLAAVEVGVEVDGRSKAAMRCALGGIVAMRRKVSAVLGAIADDEKALNLSGVVLIGFAKLGYHREGKWMHD